MSAKSLLRAVPAPPNPGGRPPPCDLDAEGDVLEAVLVVGGPAIDEVRGILGAEHWFSDSNRLVWQAAAALHDAGLDVNVVSVAGWLRDQQLIGAAGGASYLAELTARPYRRHLLTETAERVLRKARLRKAIDEAWRIAAEGYGELDDEDAETWLEQLPERLRGDDVGAVEAVHVGEAMRRVWEERREHARLGTVKLGPSTGLPDLDAKIGGLRPGKVMCVAARSYVGKTAFAMQVSSYVAAMGGGVLIHELEAPEDECVERLQYATAGVDGSRLLAGMALPPEDMRALTGAAVTMSRSPLYIDNRSGVTITDIRGSARRLSRRLEKVGVKLALVVIDYVQLVSARDMVEKASNREAAVAHVSREAKRLAMDLKVHVMLLAQLNKEGDKRGDDSRPRTSDMRESSAIENDADHIVLLHNPHRLARSRGERDGEPTDDVEIILGKNRGGKPGTINALWIPGQQSFQCTTREWNE